MTRRLCALLLAFALWPARAPAQEVVHGADSLFVSPGVKLAWAVRRGATEAEALVLVRIIAGDPTYRLVRVDGIDPFSKQHKVFVATRPLDRATDVAIPRAAFADHPSTEFRFFANAKDAAADKPKLTVFYLGVPDTTPEFPGQREAEAYLERMIGQR